MSKKNRRRALHFTWDYICLQKHVPGGDVTQQSDGQLPGEQPLARSSFIYKCSAFDGEVFEDEMKNTPM